MPILNIIFAYREIPQTLMRWLELLGKLKCRATGLNASLSFHATSSGCSRKRSPSVLPVH